MPQKQGSIRLFQISGIEVFLHWSWILVGGIEIFIRKGNYSSLFWNVAEYLTLFAIVLMHEFGHALACRSVGGKADQIMLWPLGGVAYVQPPQRPGPVLWSIAAGPLVNLVLIVPAFLLYVATQGSVSADLSKYFFSLVFINGALFVFNCFPIYPLDGGQMLRAVLWFFIGRAKSLTVAATIGLVGAVALLGVAALMRSMWFVVLAVFGAMRAWAALKHAKALSVLLAAPTHRDHACPDCKEHPPAGPFWHCECGSPVDVYVPICPGCSRFLSSSPTCFHCGSASPLERWRSASFAGGEPGT